MVDDHGDGGNWRLLMFGSIFSNYLRLALALSPTTHRETDYASEA
jgi:hypothetical protein